MENLIEKPAKKTDEDGEEKKRRPIIKSATDLQRLKLEKLMKNPDKPIMIPEQPREKDYMQTVPSFVRNVMGSSAGAGSGEFHVYRHLRRKEYARQKCIQAKSIREQLDEEYQMKLEKNRLEAEAKTAKKRAKRIKKKQRAKKPRNKQEEQKDEGKDENTSEEDDDEEANEENEKADDVMDTGDDGDQANQNEKTIDVTAEQEEKPVGPVEREHSEKNVQEKENCKDDPTVSGEDAVQGAAEKEEAKTCEEVAAAKELSSNGSDEKNSAGCDKSGESTSVEQSVEEQPN